MKRAARSSLKIQYAKNCQKIAICTPLHYFVGLYLRNQAEQNVKQRRLPHMSSQYGKLRPISGSDWFVSLRHPRKFQWVSLLGFVTAATSLNAQRQLTKLCTMNGRLLGWETIYTRFCPVTEFCQVQNSLCIQVLHSPILAALLHGTRVVGVSQTAALSRGSHLYSTQRPSRRALAHILVFSPFIL